MSQTRHIDYDASTPQVITDEYGRPIGVLQPRVPLTRLAASAGIQSHSIPGRDNVVTLYGGPHVVSQFARHWNSNTGRTYPFSK